MEIKIENILILWDEKVTDIFVSLINTLSLSFSEKEIRNSMAKLSENRELRKAVRLRLRSASSLGSPKDDNRPRKGNGEPTADC